MQSGAGFWAVALILVGVVLLLGNLGIVTVGWDAIWPLLLVALGVWILWGAVARPRQVEAQAVTIPLEQAARARVRISHGAGHLQVAAGAAPDQLAAGTFGGGLDYRAKRDGDSLDLKMRIPDRGFGWFWGPWGVSGALDWSVRLNGEVPLDIEFKTGAGEARLDLSDLLVTGLEMETGASSTTLMLPAHAGYTRVKIAAGAAAVDIRVPDGVAVRLRTQSGLASIKVDSSRFPGTGNFYQSPQYDTAPNKIDMDVEAGVGSVNVR
jgi:hypothetical protein